MSTEHPHDDEGEDYLDADEALEEIDVDGEDVDMDSDNEEITLQNDSIAFFDAHKDSVFAIAQHPRYPSIIATGGSEGEEDDAPGKAYVIDTSSVPERPVLPASYAADPSSTPPRSVEIQSIFTIEGHADSVSALTFTLPDGEVLVSGGMDGQLRAYQVDLKPGSAPSFKFIAEAQEVPEIVWIAPCPAAEYPNTIALGASDGSVWVYTIDVNDTANPLQIVQSYFLHTGSCTAGAWTPDGSLLATVSEDSSLYVWDVWGLAAVKGLVGDNGTAVSLTEVDQRFAVEGGLYSVAIDPRSTLIAAGGVGGVIKIVSLPRLGASQPQSQAQAPKKKNARGGNTTNDPAAGGQILASLHTQTDTIETLSFSTPTSQTEPTLLAAGAVDSSVVVYDATRRFAVRRHIVAAHDDHSVVKVEFVKGSWILTTCGMDGVVRRWDLRAGGAPAPGAAQGAQASSSTAGLVKEWKGHRGGGEGGGVLGFVQAGGERVITAGDDGVVLLFEA